MREPNMLTRVLQALPLQLLAPVIALGLYAGLKLMGGNDGAAKPGLAISLVIFPVLLATVMAAVFHAEKIAHRIGEPFGTLLLTIAVTIIEVALLLTIMLGEHGEPTLVRDTVFSVIMIVCNGLVGLCLLLGGVRYREQGFEVRGASAYLAVLTALSVLTLILPNYTTTTTGPTLAPSQLRFVALVTLLLYAVFLYIQTVRHTDYFTEAKVGSAKAGAHPDKSQGSLLSSAVLLIASLLAVVLLSKTFTASVQAGLIYLGAPHALAGFLVALLILLPESITALRASRSNELQRSINLALGSSLATIGLTVPAVAAISLYLGNGLILGLDGETTVLLLLTLLVSTLTFGTGRTNILYGFIHLIIFATYILLIFVP